MANTRTALWSEGLGAGDVNTGTYLSPVNSVGGDSDSTSTARSDKSLGRKTFSRAGKEMFMGLRPLYDARIAHAKEYDVIRDQLFRRGLAMMGSDSAKSDIAKVSNTNFENARQAAVSYAGGDSSSGNNAGASQYFTDKALEGNFDYTAQRLSPDYKMKQLLQMLGLTENEIASMLDFGSAGQLHGLTQDLNPQSRNSGGGIGGLLGGIAGGLDWNKILGIGGGGGALAGVIV